MGQLNKKKLSVIVRDVA